METILVTIAQDDTDATRHRFYVARDGGVYQDLGFVEMDTLYIDYTLAATGSEYDFKAIGYNGPAVGGEVEVLTGGYIPGTLFRVTDATTTLVGSWSDVGGTVAKSAAGSSGATATYSVNLNQIPGWKPGKDVEVYRKNPDDTASATTKITIDEVIA